MDQVLALLQGLRADLTSGLGEVKSGLGEVKEHVDSRLEALLGRIQQLEAAQGQAQQPQPAGSAPDLPLAPGGQEEWAGEEAPEAAAAGEQEAAERGQQPENENEAPPQRQLQAGEAAAALAPRHAAGPRRRLQAEQLQGLGPAGERPHAEELQFSGTEASWYFYSLPRRQPAPGRQGASQQGHGSKRLACKRAALGMAGALQREGPRRLVQRMRSPNRPAPVQPRRPSGCRARSGSAPAWRTWRQPRTARQQRAPSARSSSGGPPAGRRAWPPTCATAWAGQAWTSGCWWQFWVPLLEQ